MGRESGCHINNMFFGCIMYADDIVIMSPSLVGLQHIMHMLDKCTEYGNAFNIVLMLLKLSALQLAKTC